MTDKHATVTAELAKLLRVWRNDPELYAEQVLGIWRYSRWVAEGRPAGQVHWQQWQSRVLRDVARSPRVVIKSGKGVGKALAHGETVMTPGGEVPIEDIREGDYVLSVDGTATRVTGVFPQGEVDIYRVSFDDGCYLDVCGEHQWLTYDYAARKRWDKPAQVRTTLEIKDTLRAGPESARARNHSLPVHSAMNFAPKPVSLDAYVLGLWLGDGSAGNAHISSNDEFVAQEIQRCEPRFKVAVKGISLNISGGLKKELINLGILGNRSWEKSVPHDYKFNSVAVRLGVLQGLMDTDGTCGKGRGCSFTSVSENLAKDVAWLVRSLGGMARLGKVKKPYYYKGEEKIMGRDAYNVFIRLPDIYPPFRLPRKLERLPQSAGKKSAERYYTRYVDDVVYIGKREATCISVDHPTSLFMAKDFIVTHNTMLLAVLILWFLTTHDDAKMLCTSPSSPQLFDALWAEAGKWARAVVEEWRGVFEYEVKGDSIELGGTNNFASARTARRDQPEALQGFHAGNVMVIADEASGIDDKLFEVLEGAMSTRGAKSILTGNATRVTGYFFDCFGRDKERWVRHTVSGLDSELVDPEHVEAQARKWGRDSAEFLVGVMGEFPLGGLSSIIPLHWVREAVGRGTAQRRGDDTYWGLDVSRSGADRCALAKRRGWVLLEPVMWWKSDDLMATCGRVMNEFYKTPVLERPKYINVDVIGIGAGVFDRLRELGLPVRAINVATVRGVRKGYKRLRDDLWYRAREWFEGGLASLPDVPEIEEFISEITAVEYDFNSDGTQYVADKKAVGWSPDLGDAFVLTFAQEFNMKALREGVARTDAPVYADGNAGYLPDMRAHRGGYVDGWE